VKKQFNRKVAADASLFREKQLDRTPGKAKKKLNKKVYLEARGKGHRCQKIQVNTT